MTTRALRPGELALIEAALARRGRYRDRLFVILCVATGFRVSELLTLRVGQLVTPEGQIAREVSVARRDLKNGRSVVHAKGVRSRRVPLCERARAAIGDWLASLRIHPTAETYVFLSKKGQNEPLRRCQAHHIIKSAAWDAGLDATRVGCHSGRKAFAKNMLSASGSLVATQRLLGHASPFTTALYIETTREELDGLVLSVDPLAPAAPAVGRLAAGSIPQVQVSLL